MVKHNKKVYLHFEILYLKLNVKKKYLQATPNCFKH